MACAITPVRPSSGLRRPVPSFANAQHQLGLTLPNSARIASCYFTQSSNSCRQVRCSSAAASASAAWPEASGPAERSALDTVFAQVRAVLFYAVTFIVSIPLFTVMLAVFPLVVALDSRKRRAEHAVNRLWAQMSTWPFYRVEIEGRENLPSNDTASVYVANHESFLDIFTLFHLGRDFKFVSKVSNFIIPIIGWSMFLTGHVMLNRADSQGFRRFLEVGRSLLRAGASLLIFPEGTRTDDGRLQPFKKGAFSIAKMSKVQVVPISLVGTGALMPNKEETKLFPGSCKIVVHPPIDTRGKKTEEVAELCQKAVASRLPAWKVQPTL